MKTSNKLLVVIVLLIFGSLILHNLSLKAVYLKGEYKNRFYEMENLPFDNFDAVNLDPEGFTRITIEQGPKFAVWVNGEAKNELIITKNNHTLKIAYKRTQTTYTDKNIIIICPNLKSFIARPKGVNYYYSELADVYINNFKEDTMRLQTARSTSINLMAATVNHLNAGSDTTGGKLNLIFSNRIKEANFNMQGVGELKLDEKPISEKTTYKMSPNATLTLSRDALSLFPHQ